MISYFVRPYFDELFYSLIARYHQHTLNTSQQTCRDTFGLNSGPVNFILPNKIGLFIGKTGELFALSKDEVVDHCTPFKLLASFGTEGRSKRMYEFMMGGDSRYILNRIAGLENGVFMYCPRCAHEDRQKYGETYWHRAHNLPSVISCPRHHCMLEKWSAKSVGIWHAFHSAEMTVPLGQEAEEASSSIVEDDQQMLDILYGKRKIDVNRIARMAAEKGYVKYYNGKLRTFLREELQSFIESRYSRFKNMLESPIIQWQLPYILTGKSPGTQPRFILILDEFLARSSGRIRATEHERVKCINTLCRNFGKTLDGQFWIPRKLKYSQEGFEAQCPVCQMKFIGSFGTKKYRERILDAGHVLFETVKRLSSEGASARKIVRDLGLRKDMVRKLIKNSTSQMIFQKEKPREERSAAYKEIWLAELRSKDFHSICESNKKLYNVTRWLYRYENAWIKSKNKQFISRGRNYSYCKDYELLDSDSLIQLQEFVATLDLEKRRSRISKSLLISNTKGLKSKILDRLPRSSKYILENVESIEAYTIRRIRSYIKSRITNGDRFTRSKLFQLFNVYTKSPEVIRHVKNLCEEYNL